MANRTDKEAADIRGTDPQVRDSGRVRERRVQGRETHGGGGGFFCVLTSTPTPPPFPPPSPSFFIRT
jgi:hypothetical protein